MDAADLVNSERAKPVNHVVRGFPGDIGKDHIPHRLQGRPSGHRDPTNSRIIEQRIQNSFRQVTENQDPQVLHTPTLTHCTQLAATPRRPRPRH